MQAHNLYAVIAMDRHFRNSIVSLHKNQGDALKMNKRIADENCPARYIRCVVFSVSMTTQDIAAVMNWWGQEGYRNGFGQDAAETLPVEWRAYYIEGYLWAASQAANATR